MIKMIYNIIKKGDIYGKANIGDYKGIYQNKQ